MTLRDRDRVDAARGGVLRDLQAQRAGEALPRAAPRCRGELRAESHSCPIVHAGLLPADEHDRSRGFRQDGDRRGGTLNLRERLGISPAMMSVVTLFLKDPSVLDELRFQDDTMKALEGQTIVFEGKTYAPATFALWTDESFEFEDDEAPRAWHVNAPE